MDKCSPGGGPSPTIRREEGSSVLFLGIPQHLIPPYVPCWLLEHQPSYLRSSCLGQAGHCPHLTLLSRTSPPPPGLGPASHIVTAATAAASDEHWGSWTNSPGRARHACSVCPVLPAPTWKGPARRSFVGPTREGRESIHLVRRNLLIPTRPVKPGIEPGTELFAIELTNTAFTLIEAEEVPESNYVNRPHSTRARPLTHLSDRLH